MTPTTLRTLCAATVVLPALVAAGCRFPTDVRYEEGLATIEYQGVSSLTLPDTVPAGAEFQVLALTWGTCARHARTSVTSDGSDAEILPYNEVVVGKGISCDGVVLTIPHSATIAFDAAGVATIELRGLREPGGDTLTVSTSVVVRAAETM